MKRSEKRKSNPRSKGPQPEAARRAVLKLWYRQDIPELERTVALTAKGMDRVLPGVLKDLGLDRRRAEAEVLRVWNNLIDPNVVAHAQPTGLRRGTLFVTVDSSTWLNEIVRYRSREILQRLQHSFGPDLIAKISFRVG